MTSKEKVLRRERERGRLAALELQSRAPELDGTALIREEDKIPDWKADKDYSRWQPGTPVQDGGQVWRLITPHNAAHYIGRPAELRALWSLAHTKDPEFAKPWVAPYGTSGLYMMDECCTYISPSDGLEHVLRNLYDNNEYPPYTLNVETRWEDLGTVEEVQANV